MKTSLALLLVLLAVPALCGEPPKAAPKKQAPEDVGAEENARQRRDKHADHRQKMTTLRDEFRAAKTPQERADVQQRIQALRRTRQDQMRRTGRGGGDASAAEGGTGKGGGRGQGGGRGDGSGGGGGRGDGSGGGRRARNSATPAPPADPGSPAAPATPGAPADPATPATPADPAKPAKPGKPANPGKP